MKEALAGLLAGMEVLDEEGRLALLEEVGKLHGIGIAAFTMILASEHRGHDCDLTHPKDIVKDYLEAFRKDLYTSLEATCEINGIPFARDPNAKLREEIENE